MEKAWVLLGAASLDYLLGDPWGWPHPVQAMGAVISRLVACCRLTSGSALRQRLGGIALALLLVGGSGLLSWSLLQQLRGLSLPLSLGMESVLLASCFAGRSLRQAAAEVLLPLESGDLVAARSRLSRYVGRDTENLDESEILRAILETVAENTVDGVTAPLFYAICGALLPGVGPVPLSLAYKAASTLDSMIGYKREPWRYLGWFSAKLEDILTWLPCRLTVLTLALLAGRPRYILGICRRDGPQDPSPNSGWSEAVYAAILGVQLGGVNSYRGVVQPKPLLGNALHPITPEKLQQALSLMRQVFFLWLGVALLLLLCRW
jgi:adenosylcobinamide-phosphate synthase